MTYLYIFLHGRGGLYFFGQDSQSGARDPSICTGSLPRGDSTWKRIPAAEHAAASSIAYRTGSLFPSAIALSSVSFSPRSKNLISMPSSSSGTALRRPANPASSNMRHAR